MRNSWGLKLGRAIAILAMVTSVVGCATQQANRHRLARYKPTSPKSGVFEDRARPDLPASEQPGTASHTDPNTDDNGSGGNGDVTAPNIDRSDLLEVADRIAIVWSTGFEEKQHRDVIDGTGSVNLQYIGRIRLSGLTTSGAEDLIEKTFIKKGIYDQVSVSVIKEQEELYVQGEVKRPGAIPVTSGLTLTQAIGKAGGFGTFANPKKIYLTRDGKISTYNYYDIFKGKDSDPKLKAGDVINVDRKW